MPLYTLHLEPEQTHEDATKKLKGNYENNAHRQDDENRSRAPKSINQNRTPAEMQCANIQTGNGTYPKLAIATEWIKI